MDTQQASKTNFTILYLLPAPDIYITITNTTTTTTHRVSLRFAIKSTVYNNNNKTHALIEINLCDNTLQSVSRLADKNNDDNK